ncbi:MAG: hypothetical protein WD823_08555 [Sulfuricaulis sp.]|uniref:hypothetical protein n=1 Tax=Sulfuricaulis sp. TaxID=2003553 RepID=UPI0034A516D7
MKAHKQIFWFTLIGVAAIIGPGAIYLYLLGNAPLSFASMDFDGNGIVTFGELAYAGAYETRRMPVGEKSCTEIYSLKDGRRLKSDCGPCDTVLESLP